jgi:hypothetical protein
MALNAIAMVCLHCDIVEVFLDNTKRYVDIRTAQYRTVLKDDSRDTQYRTIRDGRNSYGTVLLQVMKQLGNIISDRERKRDR